MALLNGPELDKIAETLRERWADRLDYLIDALSEDYPFGGTKRSPVEQLVQYRAMQQNQALWTPFIANLERRYAGLPNARDRVQKAIDAYVTKMQGLEAKMAAGGTIAR